MIAKQRLARYDRMMAQNSVQLLRQSTLTAIWVGFVHDWLLGHVTCKQRGLSWIVNLIDRFCRVTEHRCLGKSQFSREPGARNEMAPSETASASTFNNLVLWTA